MIRYAVTIFLSAFLLFQVQPIVGKFILPWFGGSPAVWTTCMLFFQVLLLLGYSYAHFVASLPSRTQTVVHVGLLAASLWFLPIAPSAMWKPSGEEMPILRILGLLAATIGLPYFLLSSTGPLLQESFRRETGRTPYRLYSLSNVGSLLALLSYPFVFEPELKLQTQIVGWSWGYLIFAVGCSWCAIAFARADRAGKCALDDTVELGKPAPKPAWQTILLWAALAACGSVMLLATTNQLCQEVSSVPFLWVVPLAIYLLSFIICFDHERWYHRGVFLVLLVGAVGLACYALVEGTALDIWRQLAIYSTALFACCMVCHGELVRSKPAPQYATLFYLIVAAGGALGGILVAIAAPLLLNDFWEYPLGLAATVLLALLAMLSQAQLKFLSPRVLWASGAGISIVLGLALGWGSSLTGQEALASSFDPHETNLETARNFYGVLRVNLEDDPADINGPRRELKHGRIQHGFQYLDPELKRKPTTYYGERSGVGLAIENHPKRSKGPLRIGVIGLGCGTLATYGKQGDYIRFYEINPEVIRISEEYFSYRHDSQAEVDVVLGDARIKLEQELAAGQPQRFDVLAVDAFSSDAIPMHLLTKECAELFKQHLEPDGLLCLHISNRFLNLTGVTRGIAEALDSPCVLIDAESQSDVGVDYSTWVIVTRNQAFLDDLKVIDAVRPWAEWDPAPILWTDDYGSLWKVLDE